jgi:hypothetical protein
LGFGVWGLGFKVKGSGHRVQGSGHRVQYRVQGSGLMVNGQWFSVSLFRVKGVGVGV